MPSLKRKVLIGLPAPFHNELQQLAACEHRTFSDLAREALRRYFYEAIKRHPLLTKKEDNYVNTNLPD
jgi:hypothetical protein